MRAMKISPLEWHKQLLKDIAKQSGRFSVFKLVTRFKPQLVAPLVFSVVATTQVVHAQSTQGGIKATDAEEQIVDISGTHFTLNGNPWLPKGLQIRGFIARRDFEKSHERGVDYNARINYGPAELAAAKNFGADELRFQVSQPALDPQNPLYDADYVRNMEEAIKSARKNGFVVIISLQDERRSGEPKPHPLPTAATERDWIELNTVFGMDQGVMFELYNEPSPRKSAGNWLAWAYGGLLPNEDEPSVGMQTIVNDLRTAGCVNAIILDGLNSAGTLEGVPSNITDPLHRLAYAVHPYQMGSNQESSWGQRFGLESQSVPVIVTEWSAQTDSYVGLRNLPTYQVAVDLLNYLSSHSIPLSAGAFDIPNFMSQNVPGWLPTNYDNYSPLQGNDNAGLLVNKLFTNDYNIILTSADGVTH